jgi:hypothetical protein
MPDENRPKDRPYTKKQKPPARVVKMKLDLDLVDALEEMARNCTIIKIGAPAPRKLPNMIDCALRYAVWKYSHGEGPEAEMQRLPQGYLQWNENLRAKPRVQ